MSKERPNPRYQYGPGPWDDEPDRLEFEAHGLPCLMRRQDLGAWCGYAAVSPGHPLHGKHWDEVDLYAHGGITYAAGCSADGEICHVPKPGEPDDVWWFGFDCAHCDDLVPWMVGQGMGIGEYRDVDYVKNQCIELAAQLKELANG